MATDAKVKIKCRRHLVNLLLIFCDASGLITRRNEMSYEIHTWQKVVHNKCSSWYHAVIYVICFKFL